MSRVRRQEELTKKTEAEAKERESARVKRERRLKKKGVVGIIQLMLQDYGITRTREMIGYIIRILDKIIKHPNQQKFRRVKLKAAKIQKLIIRPTGPLALLYCIGFEHPSQGEDDILLLGTQTVGSLKKKRDGIYSLAFKKTQTIVVEEFKKALAEEKKKAKVSIERVYYAAIELRKLFTNVITSGSEGGIGKVSNDFLSLDAQSQSFRYRLRAVPRSVKIMQEFGFKLIRGFWRVENPVITKFDAAVTDLDTVIKSLNQSTPIHKAVLKLVKANPDAAVRALLSILMACLSKIVEDPLNSKFHKLKLKALFRKSGFLDGSRDLITRLGFRIDDITETAHLRLLKSGDVDVNIIHLRRDEMKRSWEDAMGQQ
mmetsp:Transcript_21966/g.34593  ORF Transcript_21966/g.34593 Transcript_21966/m.34593 type:complete len:372 (-) Transcript_21966:313-1428(-)